MSSSEEDEPASAFTEGDLSEEEQEEQVSEDQDSDFEESAPKKARRSAAAAKGTVQGKREKDAEGTKKNSGGSGTKSKARSAAAAKGETVGEKDAEKMVLEYMKAQNRPYSQQNVFDNLHAKVKKAAVLKILDKLADQGKLQRKEFGKAKVYLIDQSSFEETSSEQLEKMDKENTELKNQHQDLAKAVNKATEDLQRILKEPTDQEIDSELLSLEKDIQVATNILDSLSSEMGKSALVSEEVFEMEEKKLSELRKTLKKRKHSCIEMVECVADGQGKKPREVMEELGFELDDDRDMLAMGMTSK